MHNFIKNYTVDSYIIAFIKSFEYDVIIWFDNPSKKFPLTQINFIKMAEIRKILIKNFIRAKCL